VNKFPQTLPFTFVPILYVPDSVTIRSVQRCYKERILLVEKHGNNVALLVNWSAFSDWKTVKTAFIRQKNKP